MYVYQEWSPSRRLTGIATVALLHVAIIYALVTGLGRQAIEVLRGPVETKLIEEVKPPPYVPPPDIQVRQPVSERAIAAVVRQPAPAPVVAPPAPEPVRTKPSVEVGKSCRIPIIRRPPKCSPIRNGGAAVPGRCRWPGARKPGRKLERLSAPGRSGPRRPVAVSFQGRHSRRKAGTFLGQTPLRLETQSVRLHFDLEK